MTVLGLDLSNNNATVDLVQVQQSGRQFLAHKATEGTWFRDALFPARWKQAHDLGMARIAYDFARPDLCTPEQEAAYFCSYIQEQGPQQVGDGYALDFEMSAASLHPHFAQRREVQWEIRKALRDRPPPPVPPIGSLAGMVGTPIGAPDMATWAITWLQTVQATLGPLPFFYSGLWFLGPQGLLNNAILAQSGLWYGYWASTLPQPPSGYSFIAIWQNSESGSVPGVVGPCDTDVFEGTIEQLRSYGVQAVTPQPPPPTRSFTNDDFTQSCRYMLEQPPNLASLRTYLEQFP